MKKALSLVLVLVLCLSLCACNAAFDNSKAAFEHITEAYLATNEFSQDVYEAWRLGVNNKYSYDSEDELAAFAEEMHISLDDIKAGVASLHGTEEYEYGQWKTLYTLYDNSYFSAWVSAISEAYKCNGKSDAIRDNLEEAKNLMKSMSEDHSDYEHYPELKNYFTNTLAFYDFCQNPEGSFEQVVETFNTYRNNARESFFDLNYIFCDSIEGMSEFD